MSISLKGKRMLYKSELMMLEMLANTNWERPLYMAITVGSDNHLNLGNNFMQEGLAYRITPFNTTQLNARIDSEKMYDNLMNKFKFGGIDKPGIYIDENTMRMCYTHRRIFAQLITQLMKEGKKGQSAGSTGIRRKDDSGFQRALRCTKRSTRNGRSLLPVGKQYESRPDYR